MMNYELPETQNRPINLNDNNNNDDNNNSNVYIHAYGLLQKRFCLHFFFFVYRVPGDVLTAKRIKTKTVLGGIL